MRSFVQPRTARIFAEERREILELLAEDAPLSTAEISKRLYKKPHGRRL